MEEHLSEIDTRDGYLAAVRAYAHANPDRLWIGASYQAQPGLGEMQLQGTLTTTYAGASSPFDVTFRQACEEWMRYVEFDRKRRPSTIRDTNPSGMMRF